MILIAVAIQSFACTAMDKDNDQQLIEAFVTRKQYAEQDEPISFCSPIDSELAKYFPSKPLPLSASTHAAIANICTNQPKHHSFDSVKITPSSPTEVTTHPVEKNDSSRETSCSSKTMMTTEQQKPSPAIKPALISPAKVKSQPTNRTQTPLTRYQNQEKIFSDREKIEERAEKLHAQLISDPRKSKRNGPYLHKSTNQLFFKLNESRSCVYNGTTQSLLVLDTPYVFPDAKLLANIKATFAELDNPELLQSGESVIQWK